MRVMARRGRGDLEWCGDSGARLRSGLHAKISAWRSRRCAQPLYRSGGERRPDRIAVCPEREPAARTEIRLQTALGETSRRSFHRAAFRERASRARGGFQCRANRVRNLSDNILFQQRAGTAAGARCVSNSPRATLGRCDPRSTTLDSGQGPDFIALRGDPSDKLPGAPGVGTKRCGRAIAQIRHAGTGAASRTLSSRAKKKLLLYKSITTMDRRAPLPRLPAQAPNFETAAKLAQEWELNALAKRLDQIAAAR